MPMKTSQINKTNKFMGKVNINTNNKTNLKNNTSVIGKPTNNGSVKLDPIRITKLFSKGKKLLQIRQRFTTTSKYLYARITITLPI